MTGSSREQSPCPPCVFHGADVKIGAGAYVCMHCHATRRGRSDSHAPRATALRSHTHRVTFPPSAPWPCSASRASAESLLSSHMYLHLSPPSSRVLVMCVGRHVCVCPERLSLRHVLGSLTLDLGLLSNQLCPASPHISLPCSIPRAPSLQVLLGPHHAAPDGGEFDHPACGHHLLQG